MLKKIWVILTWNYRLNAEKTVINKMDKMCTQSLSPDVYEKWEIVKDHLISARHIKL